MSNAETPVPSSVALLGTGPMGAPIARNLIAAGVPLKLWNRTAHRAKAILAGHAVDSPAEAASQVVLTVLPDLPQVEQLLHGPDGLLAGWKAAGIDNPILVVHGTVSPVAVAALATECRRIHGVTVIDAPLSGGTIGAEQGRLSIMVGGPHEVVERLRPLFGLYSSTVLRFGDTGSGSTAKACNQIVVAATVTAISEAMALAEASGLDLGDLQSILAGGLANSEVLRQKGKRWIDADFDGGGSAKNQLKDLTFIAEIASEAGLDLPVSRSVRGAFEKMIAQGRGELDHTGIYLSMRVRQQSAERGLAV